MKRLFTGALALILSIAASATTLNPVQLLNPTGSASGQAVVSTGASSAPSWGGVGVNGIAAIAANTVLANATGSSASPAAFAMPSCSATGNALNWTTSTGFICQTGLATLASPTFTGTPAAPTATAGTSTTQIATTAFLTQPGPIGSVTANTGAFTTLGASGLITPTSTIGIKGTTAADNAQAGSWEEYAVATNSAGSAISNSTNTNVTSLPLTAGDWRVCGSIEIDFTGSNTGAFGWLTTTSVANGQAGQRLVIAVSTGAGSNDAGGAVPCIRVNLNTSSTVFLVGYSSFTTGSATAYGQIWADRRR